MLWINVPKKEHRQPYKYIFFTFVSFVSYSIIILGEMQYLKDHCQRHWFLKFKDNEVAVPLTCGGWWIFFSVLCRMRIWKFQHWSSCSYICTTSFVWDRAVRFSFALSISFAFAFTFSLSFSFPPSFTDDEELIWILEMWMTWCSVTVTYSVCL